MSKEANKLKTTNKKLNNVSRNMEFEIFLKNQQNIVSRLKTELKSVTSKLQLSDCGTAEKDKYLLELEDSINKREADIYKLNSNLDHLKEENTKILTEFHSFKEKFYQLEIDYDKNLNQQKQENDNLREQLREEQTIKNRECEELSLKCEDLQQRLQDTMEDFNELNKLHVETLQHLEKMKSRFEQQQTEIEIYKNQLQEDKRLTDEKNKVELDNLKEELKQKEDILKQCISDKNKLEKEKNLIIDELNNKIFRIERAFSQPTKVVEPLAALSKANNLKDSSTSERSNENIAITKPQAHNSVENASSHLSNNENQKGEQDQKTHRSHKFERPVQLQANSQQGNLVTDTASNRKRRHQPLRQTTTPKAYNEFSLSSSEEDDDTDISYSTFSRQNWRPTNQCYVADTDASEGFAKPKRYKK